MLNPSCFKSLFNKDPFGFLKEANKKAFFIYIIQVVTALVENGRLW